MNLSNICRQAIWRGDILRKALSSSSGAAVEAIIIADTLQPGLDPHGHQAKYINVPFRREEYQTALDAVNAAIETAAGAANEDLTPPRHRPENALAEGRAT